MHYHCIKHVIYIYAVQFSQLLAGKMYNYFYESGGESEVRDLSFMLSFSPSWKLATLGGWRKLKICG